MAATPDPGRSNARDPLRAPGREALDALAHWRPRLEDPTCSMGAWVGSRTDAEGVIHLGWFEESGDARALRSDLAAHGWIQAFDWPAWATSSDGERLIKQPEGVERATAEDLVRLLTAIVRSDRFTEGSFAGAFESGLLTRIARRAEQLALAAAAEPRGGHPAAERRGEGAASSRPDG